MDSEQIKMINRKALEAAKAAQGGSQSQMMVYAAAVAVAVAVYFLLKSYQPALVMVVSADQTASFDQTRAIVASAIVGLAVVLVHHLMQ